MAVLRAIRRAEPDLGFAAAVAFVLAGLAYWIQGRIGLNLRDEGFLWYGAVRTVAGEVPLRDFRSYDPGRYYWCAAWMRLFGEGILGLRLASTIFQGLGLACGLLAARRAVGNRWLLLPIGLLLLVWMAPPWKLFEPSLAMAAVYVGLLLLERPTAARHAAAGAFVGLAGFFGRNHGLYTLAAMGALLLLAHLKGDRRGLLRKLASFTAGVLAGLAPYFALIALVPGFLGALLASIRFYFEQEALNAPLPVPWPWTLPLEHLGIVQLVKVWGFALCYALLPLFSVLAVGVAVLSKRPAFPRKALLAACGVVGAIYLHHVSVRSDTLHLAQCIHPLWIGAIAIPGALRERGPGRAPAWIAVGALLLAGATIGLQSPLADRLARSRPGHVFSQVDVAGEEVSLDPATAFLLARVPEVLGRHVEPGEEVWIASQLLALYPVLDRRSPVWDIYPAWRANERDEARMLGELSGVRWILHVDEIAVNESMALPRTYPRVWAMIPSEFDELALPRWPPSFHLFERKRP